MKYSTRKKRLLILTGVVLIGFGLFDIISSRIGGVHVRRTSNGWTCSGPSIQYCLGFPRTAPILSGEKFVIVEQYKKTYYMHGFRIGPTTKSFLRDTFYITALALSDGHTVYRRKIRVEGHPLQVFGMWPWGENVVVWGYYQTEPRGSRITVITILNGKGRTINQFGLKVQPTAVDQKNNILICRSGIFDLASGVEKFRPAITEVVDMRTDRKGNVYVLRRVKSAQDGDKEGILDALAEKYSVVPWKKQWSVGIRGTAERYPVMLKCENGLLWYAVNEPRAGDTPEDRTKWIGGPLDSETGRLVETERKCDPYRLQTVFGGKSYTVTRKGTKLVVNIAPDKKAAD